MKNYRSKVMEAMPKLKALDGYRNGCQVFEPGQIDVGDGDRPDYNVNEDWYNSDIQLANPAKQMF